MCCNHSSMIQSADNEEFARRNSSMNKKRSIQKSHRVVSKNITKMHKVAVDDYSVPVKQLFVSDESLMNITLDDDNTFIKDKMGSFLNAEESDQCFDSESS